MTASSATSGRIFFAMSPSAVTSDFRITAQDDFTSATIEVPSTTINRSASASGPRSRSSYQNHVGPAYVKAFCPRSRTACKVQSSDKVLRSRSASIRKLLGLNSQSKVMGASTSCRQIVQVRTERRSEEHTSELQSS